jgi:hypothetical protein
MEPRVMDHSQSHRLRERMVEARIEHGQEVRADLPGIRVSADLEGWRTAPEAQKGVVFFCTMGAITVRQVLATGDGAPLPTEAIVEGLVVPQPGTYDILNALIHSNGALQLRVDAETQIVPRAREFDQAWL